MKSAILEKRPTLKRTGNEQAMSLSPTDKRSSQESQVPSKRARVHPTASTIGSVSKRGTGDAARQSRSTMNSSARARGERGSDRTQNTGHTAGRSAGGTTGRTANRTAGHTTGHGVRNRDTNRGTDHREARGGASATRPLERIKDALLAHKKLAVTIFVLVVVIVGLYGPIQGYYHAVRDAQELQVTQKQIEEENKDLNNDVQRLQTPEGIKDKAHERGYVSDDENSVSVEGVGNTTSDDKPKEKQRPEHPWYIQLLDAIFGYAPTDAQE